MVEVRARQEGAGRGAGLLLAFGRAGQHHVAGLQPAAAARLSSSPAGADLDVVGMRADREHGQRPRPAGASRCSGSMAARYLAPARERRRHPGGTPAWPAPERSGSQTIHGQLPRWYISSSWARSFTVSAGDQYPLYGIGEDPPLRDQPHERVLHEVLALVEVVEDLGPEHEVAAVLPLAQVLHGGHLRDQPVLADVHHVV